MTNRDWMWLLIELGPVIFMAGMIVMQIRQIQEIIRKMSARFDVIADTETKLRERMARLEERVFGRSDKS